MHMMAGLGWGADLVPWGVQLGEGGDEVWGAWGQAGGGSDDRGGCQGRGGGGGPECGSSIPWGYGKAALKPGLGQEAEG